MTTLRNNATEAEARECAALRVNGTRGAARLSSTLRLRPEGSSPKSGQALPAKMLIKVLICGEVSTLGKSRESFQGAHGVQGAHFHLSTLESPQLDIPVRSCALWGIPCPVFALRGPRHAT
jgi:hypothetical protein